MTKSPRCEDRTRDRLLTRRYAHPTEIARPTSKTFKSIDEKGTFSSETSANRHNSGKCETLIALQNDLRFPAFLVFKRTFIMLMAGRIPKG